MHVLKKKFFNHPLLKKDKLEYRFYQETIVGACSNKNSLIVLPTGLGKTIIAILVSVIKLNKIKGSKVIFLAPTKPLIQQHYETYKTFLNLDPDQMALLTGTIPPDKRLEMINYARIYFYTPQTLQNDIINNRIDLSDVSLIIFDEAHRAVGNYAYVFIADKYMKNAKNPQILAITASPGSEKEKISEIIDNLYIEKIEVRTEDSPDVKPYIQPIEINWRKIDLPVEFMEIKSILEDNLRKCILYLYSNSLLNTKNINNITRNDLISLQKLIPKKLEDPDADKTDLFESLRVVALAIRFSYMLELLETQGISSLSKYLDKQYESIHKKSTSKTVKELMQQPFINRINQIAKSLIEKGIEHPKISVLKEILEKQFQKKPNSRVIVFCHFRTTAKIIFEYFKDHPSINAIRFVGQQSRMGDKGLTQKDQIEILRNFKAGYYNTLIATSVAEEGLDIEECDLIIFYDTVPSAIRDIQRRGRTGRKHPGEVIILITKNTRDESYYWVSYHKKKKMNEILAELIDLSNELNEKAKKIPQRKISEFISGKKSGGSTKRSVESDKKVKESFKKSEESDQKIKKIEIDSISKSERKISIIVDTRESSSSILKELSKLDAYIETEKLEVGDYILSDRVAIERKTPKDFVDSIIDSRLFKEIKSLKNRYRRVYLVIEGDFVYNLMGMRKEAIQGALISILLDFYVPIIFTKNSRETAHWLYKMAKREQDEERRPLIRPEKSPKNLRKTQEYILAGFPDIDNVRARELLQYFGSLENIFNAPVEELIKVKGIGSTIAQKMKEILKTRYI